MHKSVDTCADKQSARCSVGVSSINQWADRCRCPNDANRTNLACTHDDALLGGGSWCRTAVQAPGQFGNWCCLVKATGCCKRNHRNRRKSQLDSRTRILYFDEASHCRTRCTSCHKQNTTNKHARVSWMETFPVPTESFPKAAICNHPELF